MSQKNSSKIKNNLWEIIFRYPSFNTRFLFTLVTATATFIALAYFLLKNTTSSADKYSILNLIIQFAVLILGIFAAYYALRQLVETRFNGLDESAMTELRSTRYLRAFHKWREAFYIRPEATVFINMCETMLLLGDHETFDQHMKVFDKTGLIKRELSQEPSDRITILYLKAIRHLLVKNQGAAERFITDLLQLTNEDGLQGFQWNFIDLQRSKVYLDLNGECKNIAENLIAYLSGNLQTTRKTDFEQGRFSSQSQ